jgi:cytoskeletal protein RodZ
MSDELTPEPVTEQGGMSSQIAVWAVLALVGVLALTAIIFIARDRLDSTIASDGQDTSAVTLGLTQQGFTESTHSTGGATPVALIAANLMSKAFSFTPQGFDKQVAAAKQMMNVAMQQRYAVQLKQQNTRARVVGGGMTVTTSLVHYKSLASGYPYLGVVSLTPTSGEFLMLFQRATTAAGSKQTQVTPFMLDVTVAKIGNTWILSDVQGI